MTAARMKEVWTAANDDEFLKFDRVEMKNSKRPDIHAFLLLDELVPGDGDMVSDASHDEIFLETDIEALAAVITEDQIIELVQCGVRLNSEYDTLAMFT